MYAQRKHIKCIVVSQYIWMENGFDIMPEVAPKKGTLEENMIVPSEHLDMFSNNDKDGYSIIHKMLQKMGVDTVVTGTRQRSITHICQLVRGRMSASLRQP